MSWRLVSEVMANTDGLPPRERLILVTIAEKCHDDRHRTCTPGAGVLAKDVGLTASGLKQAMQRLAKAGLEVRVPLMTGRDGRPVYAVPGLMQSYRLPEFPQVRQGDCSKPPGGSLQPSDGYIEPPGGSTKPSGGSVEASGGSGSPPGGLHKPPSKNKPSSSLTSSSPPPSARARSSSQEEEGIEGLEEMAAAVTRVLPDGAYTPTVRAECRRLLALGWTREELETAALAKNWSGAGAGVGVRWLQGLEAPRRARPRVSRPEWCGSCDEPTRTVEGPPARPGGHPVVAPCPRCSTKIRRESA